MSDCLFSIPPQKILAALDELLIPLCSARGGYLGCIALDDPRNVEAVTAPELARIELLAADLVGQAAVI